MWLSTLDKVGQSANLTVKGTFMTGLSPTPYSLNSKVNGGKIWQYKSRVTGGISPSGGSLDTRNFTRKLTNKRRDGDEYRFIWRRRQHLRLDIRWR